MIGWPKIPSSRELSFDGVPVHHCPSQLSFSEDRETEEFGEMFEILNIQSVTNRFYHKQLSGD